MREQCPYCTSTRSTSGPERGGLAYRNCVDCGSGYVEEPPIEFRDYYVDYDPNLVADLPEILVRRYQGMLARLEALTPGRRMLEVGCGNGHFLSVARGRGWEVKGTELSRAHVGHAQARGLDVVYGDLVADPLWADRAFDVVVLIEVVEHVPEPRELLAACARRLDPGGVLFVTTPNYGSMTRRILGGGWSVLGVEHVALASQRGLRRALNEVGFDVIRLWSKSLFVGEYRRLLARDRGAPDVPLAAENAELRDRIEGSAILSLAKEGANAVLKLTGLGEAMECWARKRDGGGSTRV